MYLRGDKKCDRQRAPGDHDPAVGNARVWVTIEHEHNGLRVAAGHALGGLMDMRAGRVRRAADTTLPSFEKVFHGSTTGHTVLDRRL